MSPTTMGTSHRTSAQRWDDLVRLQASRAACDRSWEYFIPSALAAAAGDDALPRTALLLGVRAVAGVLLTPAAAAAWDPRRASAFATMENLCLIASGAALWYYLSDPAHGSTALVVSAVLMAFEAAASGVLTSNVDKHRVVIESRMAGSSLSRANSVLVQIDLAAATVSPFAVSFVISTIGSEKSVILLVMCQVLLSVAMLPLSIRSSAAVELNATEECCEEDEGVKREKLSSRLGDETTHGQLGKPAQEWPIVVLSVTAFGCLFFSVISPGETYE